MSQRLRTTKTRRRRAFTYLWILALAVAVFLLIYFERTELLYILATLGVTILLVIVAVTDLGGNEPSSGRERLAQRFDFRGDSRIPNPVNNQLQ